MDQRQFAKLVLEMAQAEHPQYQWRLQAGTLQVENLADGGDERSNTKTTSASMNLASMHARAPHSGDLRGWISARLAANIRILVEYAFGDWATEAANIRPLLKPLDFLVNAERGRAAGERGAPACVFPWEGQLCVACVLDRPTTMAHINQEHLDKWQMSAEQVLEQAQANLAGQAALVIQVHDVPGFKIAHTEPDPYAATLAILPGFRQLLAKLLGPHYRILLATENLLSAYANTGAGYDPAHEEALARDLIEMVEAFGDRSKPLPYTGHLEVDSEAGTLRWEPNDAALDPDIQRDADQMLRNIERERRPRAERTPARPPSRRRYTH